MTRRRYIPSGFRTSSEEEAMTAAIFAECGGLVYSTSAGRVTRSTPGIPDKLVIFLNHRILLGWDDKAGSERYKPTDPRRLSPEQKKFGDYLALGLKTEFAWGDAAAAKEYLMRERR